MRAAFLFGFVLLSVSCSSTTPFINFSGDVNVVASDADIVSKTSFFSNESMERAVSNEMLQERGNHYLTVILDGYYSQTEHLSFAVHSQRGLSFVIKEIRVKPGYFSLNFVDPGPFYRMFMDVDIYRDGHFILHETYKVRVNMAEVVNSDKFFNWMSSEQKNKTENQLTTFERGLRGLYRNLFFKHLDISLDYDESIYYQTR